MTMEIAQLGQPVLRYKAEEIPAEEIPTEAFQKFIDEMMATVTEAGGAGLAGPQVFARRRIFLAGVLPSASEEESSAMEVFINPRLTALSEKQLIAWEGCLSFLELLVLVPRYEAVKIEYLNRHGEEKSLELRDWPARIVQHENDHLDGILTVDRAPSTRYIIKASEVEAASADLRTQAPE